MKAIMKRLKSLERAAGPEPLTVILNWFGSPITHTTCGDASIWRRADESLDDLKERAKAELLGIGRVGVRIICLRGENEHADL